MIVINNVNDFKILAINCIYSELNICFKLNKNLFIFIRYGDYYYKTRLII